MSQIDRSLTWQPEFTYGIPEIDEQHQILVDLLNVVAVTRASEPGIDLVKQILQDFVNYALFHFETEEGLMQRHGYAESEPEEATRHLEQHRLFSLQMIAARENLQSDESVPLDDIIRSLHEWLAHHIPNTDAQLCEYILRRLAGRPEI
jgi:hemerythrin